MIVVPVDDGDFGSDARERLRGEESAETRADDHDSRARHPMVGGPWCELGRNICQRAPMSTSAQYPTLSLADLEFRFSSCESAGRRGPSGCAKSVACVLQPIGPCRALRGRASINHGGEMQS